MIAFRRLASFLSPRMWAVALLALAPTAPAWAQGTYSVDGIAVRASGGNAVEARTAAIEQGQRDGLNRLLDRLAGGGAPSTAGLTVDDYVTSFEVLQETVGPTSYAATLAVDYDRDAVDRLLNRGGVAAVNVPAAPVTLVPVWETGGGLLLWEPDNAWKTAWDRSVGTEALAPFVVPLGDLQDLALVDAERAVRGDRSALLALAERYGTEEVVVARLVGSGAPGEPLDVRAQSYGSSAGAPYRAVVPTPPGQPLYAGLERAVDDMQAAYDARARQPATAAQGPTSSVTLKAPVTSLDGWGRLLRDLESLGGVEIGTVREFSRAEATLDLRVAGGATRLRDDLARSGWFLGQDPDGTWRMQQGGAPAGASPL